MKLYYAQREPSKIMLLIAKLLGKPVSGASGRSKVAGYAFFGTLYITSEIHEESVKE